MVYKKYIYKRGKRHGPYYYHSIRHGSDVSKIYIGGEKEYQKWLREKIKKDNKTIFNKKFIIPLAIVIVLIASLFLLQQNITGKINLEIQDSYTEGENISGVLKLSLRKGEMIPIDSKIIVEQPNGILEYQLSQFIHANSEGNFYVENTYLSGKGQGYGFSGVEEPYPTVFLTLKILEKKSEEASGGTIEETPESASLNETPEENATIEPSKPTENVTEPSGPTETPAEETITEPIEEIPAETTPSESEDSAETPTEPSGSSESSSESVDGSESGGSLLTGASIKENEKEIKGSCSKDYPFIYNLEEGQEAEAKKNSVEVEENGERKKIDDNEINLNIDGRVATVTTDYSIVQGNFGEEFLGDETRDLEISLEDLNIKAENGELKISLVYNGIEIVQASKEINVEQLNETLLDLNETNLTEINASENFTITTTQTFAVIGKPVKWKKEIKLDKPEKIIINLPAKAENIIIKRGVEENRENIEEIEEETNEGSPDYFGITGEVSAEIKLKKPGLLTRIWNNIKTSLRLTGKAIQEEEIEVTLEDNATEFTIEYETPAPQSVEEEIENGKRVTISGPDELHYENVLAYTYLEKEMKHPVLYHLVNGSKEKVQFTGQDLNNNGLIDYVEWQVENLSEQVYEIIEIIKAEHLDENRSFVEEIYDYVKEKDDNYYLIPNEHYARVMFEQPLDNTRDITIYARSADNNPAEIEVYTQDNGTLITKFENINEGGWYKVYLTNLPENESYDVFDLKVVGVTGIDFDYLVDPISTIKFVDPTPDNADSTANTSIEINVSIATADDVGEIIYNWDGTNYTMLNSSLVFFMNFDNVSALGENETNVVDLINGNNGTPGDNAMPAAGIYGGAYVFDGTNDNITIADATAFDIFNGQFSVAIWIKSSTSTDKGHITGQYNSGGLPRWALRIKDGSAPNTTGPAFYENAAAAKRCSGVTNIADGNWHYVVAVGTAGSTCRIYVDGKYDDGGSDTLDANFNANGYALTFGGEETGGNGIAATLDEAMMWNRELSEDEIYQLYVSNLYKYFDGGLNKIMWALYINQSKNATAVLDVGTYTYQAFAANSSGELNQTEERTITITGPDTTAPIVTYGDGTPENDSGQGNTDIYVNVTATDAASNISTFIDWDRSLIAWWRMDDANDSGDPTDYFGNYNGTLVGNALINSSSGYFGNGSYFDGSGDYINLSYNLLAGETEFTISMWVYHKTDTDDDDMFLLGATHTTNQPILIWRDNAATDSYAFLITDSDSTTGVLYSSAVPVLNEWTHFVLAFNGSNETKMYVNAIEDGNSPFDSLSEDSVENQAGAEVMVGGTPSSTDFAGMIDDVMIFNRTLTQDEVYALYANQSTFYLEKNFTDLDGGSHTFTGYSQDTSGNVGDAGGRTVTIDTTPPEVYLESPANNTLNDTSNSPEFTFNATDDVDTSLDCLLWIRNSSEDNESYGQNDTTLNATSTIITANDSLLGGDYLWWVNCSDGANTNVSEEWNLSIFVPPPDISFADPTPDDKISTANNSIEINVSITTPYNIEEVIYNWNGTNYTMFNDSLVLMLNFDNLTALGESETVALDAAGEDNNATLSSPVVNLTGRYGGAYEFDGTETKAVYVPDSDNLDLTKFTIAFWFKRKGAGCDGTCAFGNCFSDNVDVITAKGGGGGDGGTVDCNWIVGLNSNNLIFCAEYSGGSDYSLTGSTALNDGEWYYGAVTYDGSTVTTYINGAYENSGSPGGTIDTNIVDVGIGVGLEDLTSTANGAFNGTIDEFMIWNYALSADEINQLYMSNPYKYDTDKWALYVNQTQNSTDGLGKGNYTYYSYAKDKVSNENITEEREIEILDNDDHLPGAILNAPDDSSGLTESNVTFNCSATDDFELMNITLYGNWSGGWHANETVYINGTSNETTFEVNITDGLYFWNCEVCDNSSNCSFGGSNFTFTIDTVYPKIEFESLTPESFTNTFNTSIEINVSIIESYLGEVLYSWNWTNYTIFNDSLVLGFNFDNLSALGECDTWDCLVYDYSGKGNHGNLTNSSAPLNASRPTWNSAGRYNGGFEFETEDHNAWGDSILVYHNDILNPYDNDFAMMLWFKCIECDDCDISRKGSTDTGSTWYKMEIGGYGTPDLISLQWNTDNNDATMESDLDVCDSNWHFAIGQRIGTNAELWVDAVNQTSLTAGQTDTTVDGSISNTANLTIGSKDTQDDDFMNGTIDEYRLYINRSFSPEEIEILYMSNLEKYDTDKWLFYINQTQNSTDGLDNGTYVYSASVKDSAGNENLTEERTITIDTANPLSACQDLDVENTEYQLTDDVNSVETCFNVTAENVTLNCQGHLINYSTSSAGYGVVSYGYNGLTVKDCLIENDNGAVTYSNAVFLNTSNSSLVENNTIKAGISDSYRNNHLIYLYESYSSTIADNNITNDVAQSYGIMLKDSNLNFIDNNSIITNVDNAGFNHGIKIYLDNSDENTIMNNTLLGSSLSGEGLSLWAGSDNNLIQNNTIDLSGQTNEGIYIDSSTNNSIQGNNISTPSRSAIFLDGVSSEHFNQTIYDDNLAQELPINVTKYESNILLENINGEYGQMIVQHSDNVTLRNSNLSYHGISFYDSPNSRIENSNISLAIRIGVLVRYSDNFTIENSEVRTDSSYGFAVYLDNSDYVNLTGSKILSTDYNTHGITFISSDYASTEDVDVYRDGSQPHQSGIILTGSNYNNITHVNINLDSSSGSDQVGLSFSTSSNNYVENLTINMEKADASDDYGISITDDCNDNIINNSNILTNSSRSIYINTDKTTTSVFNTILNSTLGNEIYSHNDQDSGSWIKLYNVSWNESNAIINDVQFELFNYYYLDVNVTSSASALEGANVTGTNFTGDFEFSELTDLTGFIPTQSLLGFNQTNYSLVFAENYTINTTMDGYSNDSQSVNMTTNTQLDVSLTNNAAPGITIDFPSNSSYSATEIEFNISSDENLSYCYVTLDSSATNGTMTINDSLTGANYTNDSIADGSYLAEFWCNDSLNNNINNSESVAFSIDTTYPKVAIEYPTATTYTTASHNLNYTYTETGCDSVWYNNGTDNSSREDCGTNWTSEIAEEGSNTWTVFINDTAGNENSSSVTFTVDISAPSISIAYPVANTFYSENVTELNYSASDDTPDSCWYSMDDGATNSSPDTTCANFTELSGTDGENTWIVYANDSSNNENSTNVTFYSGYVTMCGLLTQANQEYTQQADIIPLEGPCINITAENITYDGNEYSISNSTLVNTGVYSDQINTTIKNCNVSLQNSWQSRGIYLIYANESNIDNNTLSLAYEGIGLNDVYYVNVTNNTIYSNEMGIMATPSFYSYFEGNNISSCVEEGLTLQNAHYNTIKNNVVSNTMNGMSVSGSDNNTYVENTILSGMQLGFYISNSNGNNITNLILNSNPRSLIIEGGSGNSFNEINIWNTTTVNNGAVEIIGASTTGTILKNSLINLSGREGLQLYQSDNSIIQNVQIISSTQNDTTVSGTSVNNTFINVSYDKSLEYVGSGDELIRKWYYKAYVNDTTSAAIEGTNITAYNVSGDYNFNLSTDDTGYTALEEMIDYVNTGSDVDGINRTYYSDYTIYAVNDSYPTVSHTYNVTSNENNYEDVFTLDNAAPTLTIERPDNYSMFNGEVEFNVSGDENLTYCGLSINGDANDTMTEFNETLFNYTNSSIADGSHNFLISCNDTVDNFGSSEEYDFYVDSVTPDINFTDETTENGTTQSSTEIIVNVSSSDTASNVSTFIDLDNSLVGWWRMDDLNDSGDVVDISGHCYDNETQILTLNENGEEKWKYFYDLNGNEKVATLNQNTGEIEYQSPIEYQEFNNHGEMYRIELEDGSNLLVSEKHKVYSSLNNLSISSSDSTLIDSCFFNLNSLDQMGDLSKYKDNANNGKSLKWGDNFLASEIYGLYSDLGMNLTILFINKSKNSNSELESSEDFIICFFKPLISKNTKSGEMNLYPICLNSLVSRNTLDLLKKENNIFVSNISNIFYSCNLATLSFTHSENSFTSLSESLDLEAIVSPILNSNSSSTSSCRTLSIALLTNLSNCKFFEIDNISLSNSSGILIQTSAILTDNIENQDYLSFSIKKNLSDFKLQPITETYSKLQEGKEIYFLDGNNNPVKVKSITKQAYNGKIYDVDVENDIILVRRRSQVLDLGGKSSDVENDIVLVRRKKNNDINNKISIINRTLSDNRGILSENKLNISEGNYNNDFKEEFGTPVWSGNSNNGTVFGNATQTDAGYLGKGFEFDGNESEKDSNEYIRINNFNYETNEATFSWWMNPQNISHIATIFFGYTSSTNPAIYFYPGTTGACRIYIMNLTGGTASWDYSCPSGQTTIGVWQYYTVTYNTSGLYYYRNGNFIGSDTTLGTGTIAEFANIGNNTLYFGRHNGDDRYFNGSLDDVLIFNRTLSAEEIYALYANQSTFYLEKNFTDLNDGNYTFKAYTQDYGGNVNETEMREVVVNQIPTVTLSDPPDGNVTTNRTPEFSWSGNDAGGGPDALEYEINITCWDGGSVVTAGSEYVDKDSLGSVTSYIPPSYLKCLSDNNQYYNWTVRAWDGLNYSEWATENNLSIQSEIIITLNVEDINFGQLNVSDSDNTTDDSPQSLILLNEGNAEVNISLNATNLWEYIVNPNNYFQYQIRNTSDGCFALETTQTSWSNVPDGTLTEAVNRLNFTSGYQSGCSNTSIDIHVEIPSDEPPGNKSSIITFVSSLAEEKIT